MNRRSIGFDRQLVSDSPVSPVTSILPLVFVIMVTAVKQAYEDLNRHRMDREVNQALYEVVRNGCVQVIIREVHTN